MFRNLIKKCSTIFEIKNNLNYYFVQSYHKSSALDKELNSNWGSTRLLEKRIITFEELKTEEERLAFEKQIQHLKHEVEKQGNIVRQLKISDRSSSVEIQEEVKVLKKYKEELENLPSKFSGGPPLDRARMDDLIKRRFYFDVAFRAYGGLTGQYDYGPTGASLLDNILAEWKKHFVVRDGMMMTNCSIITPEKVFKSSGHLDRFTDYVAKDKAGGMFRLDQFIKCHLEERLSLPNLSETEKNETQNHLQVVDNMDLQDLKSLIQKYKLKSPNTQKDFDEFCEVNLMFPIFIGSSDMKSFLKPEHAQGIILHFKKLVELNDGKLPLACAQIGLAFRNEITPEKRLLRVREFILAEIEHFCYPDNKLHPKFRQVSDTKLWLFPACNQREGLKPIFISIGEAVDSGMVGSETLGYYLSQTQRFLLKIGIHPRRLRFRQHLGNEMAHYALDCWDAECLTSYGWVECAGCVDRGDYDIRQHSEITGLNMTVDRPLKEPREEVVSVLTLDRKIIQKFFVEEAENVLEILNDLSSEEVAKLNDQLNDERYRFDRMIS